MRRLVGRCFRPSVYARVWSSADGQILSVDAGRRLVCLVGRYELQPLTQSMADNAGAADRAGLVVSPGHRRRLGRRIR